MAVDPQHPGDFRRDLLVEINQRGGEFFQLRAAFRQQQRLTGVEKYFRLEYETVADDPDVRTIAEDGTQAAEEFRAIARQFLHPLRQRDVEPLAEIGDAALRFLVALFGRVERFLERSQLTAQRADLLVQHLDLRQRARGHAFLGFERLVEFIGAALRIAAGAGKTVIEALDAGALALGGSKAGASLRELVVEIELAELFQRQQIVQLRDLGVELFQRLVLAGDFLRQEELHHQEYGQQEHDRQHQRRQCIDESRPVIETGFAAAGTGEGHSNFSPSLSCPGRGAAFNAAPQSRDPDAASMGPGSAAHRFALRSVRGTLLYV